MTIKRFSVVIFLLLVLLTARAGAEFQGQPLEYYLPPATSYDPTVPTPESFTGYQAGSWHVRHDQLVEYCRLLGTASNRVTVQEYGVTHEQRPLLLLTITRPGRDLASSRASREAVRDGERTGRIDGQDDPAIVWMGFTVHGNEASGANAALLLAYYFAAAQGPDIDSILSNSIILIDPCINPDGYARFATWVNGNRGRNPSADPESREHQETWPSGRTNHYWFDLNRDYLPLVHPESRARMKLFREWIPHVLLDFHEMGTHSTYFFQPGRSAAVHPLIPRQNQDLTMEFARASAAALDRIGSLYFTKEIFDDFYIGKGSTYADVAGSIGILYEQASVRGHRQEHPDGILTFPFAIRNHVTAALSTVREAVGKRRALQAYQRWFFESAVATGSRSPVRGFVLAGHSGQGQLEAAADLLVRHGIRVFRPASGVRVGGETFSADSSLFVPVAQPEYRLLMAMIERRTEFTDSIFYDISAWSLPDAYNLRVGRVTGSAATLAGEVVSGTAQAAGKYAGPQDPAAYVFEWSQPGAPRALGQLLERGVRARVAGRPFAVAAASGAATARFAAGSIVVPTGIQRLLPDSLWLLMQEVSRNNGLAFVGSVSALSVQGGNPGGTTFFRTELPRIAIATGPGVSSYAAGEVWYTLDHEVGLDVSLIDPSDFGALQLGRYSVLVLPSGRYGSVDSGGVAALRRWLAEGGTLIALEEAAVWVGAKGLSTTIVRHMRGDSAQVRLPYAERDQIRGAREVSGAILETIVDPTHPLLFGYSQERLALVRRTELVMDIPSDPFASPIVYSTQPLLSGHVPRGLLVSLSGTAAAVVARSGRGRVVVFMDNPVHRSYWKGTERLLINAVMFGANIDTSGSRAEQ